MREILSDLAGKITSKARQKGFTDLEFYGVWRRRVEFEVSRNKLKTISDNTVVEFGVLGALGKKIGGVSSRDVNIDIDTLINNLFSIVKSSQEDPSWQGFARGYSKGVDVENYDKNIVEAIYEKGVEILETSINESIEYAKKNGAEDVNVSGGGLNLIYGGVLIANIDGEEIYGEGTYSSFSLEVVSSRAGRSSSFFAYYSSRRLSTSEILEEARRAGEYSVKFIDAKPVESGEYTIILDPYMTGLFIQTALAPAFSALEVQENRSPLKGRIDTQILNADLNIIDDPTIPWGIGTRSFDDEGIATRRKILVEKGVLKTYVYNYYTAKREGRESTGNGFRSSPSTVTQPAVSNLIIEAKGITMSLDEMISDVKKGIIVHGMIGYWMSSYINGSTQATITHGFLVENGEVKHPVKGVVLGGNIYEWLGSNLMGVGKDVKMLGNICTPSIMFSNGRIAG